MQLVRRDILTHRKQIIVSVLSALFVTLLALSPAVMPADSALADQQDEAAVEGPLNDEQTQFEEEGAADSSTVPSSDVLSFLYIDVAEIEAGETQSVVVALNETLGTSISSASLTIQNDAGEDVMTVDATTLDAMAALFSCQWIGAEDFF